MSGGSMGQGMSGGGTLRVTSVRKIADSCTGGGR